MRLDSELAIEECEDVYPPREDTYLLIECIEPKAGQRILEMGCGSGLISLHCAKLGAIVVAADINPKAVACTLANFQRNHLQAEVRSVGPLLERRGQVRPDPFQSTVPGRGRGGGPGAILGRRKGRRPGPRTIPARSADSTSLRTDGSIVLLSTMMKEEPLAKAALDLQSPPFGQQEALLRGIVGRGADLPTRMIISVLAASISPFSAAPTPSCHRPCPGASP